MCEVSIQLTELPGGKVSARVYIHDGEGVSDAERHAAVGLSKSVNRSLHVASMMSSFKSSNTEGAR